jgi:polyhydroxyalkanoate synthesis repressor PhaR
MFHHTSAGASALAIATFAVQHARQIYSFSRAATEMSDPETTVSDESAPKGPPIKIKKYANRRLYNTATSSYVTLDHLCQMVKEGTDFVVHDAKTGADITRSVLTQIIVEEEAKGQNLLPVGFLRQLISFYGDNLQTIVPRYLDYSMKMFATNQEQMRDYLRSAFGGMFPFGPQFEEMSKKNIQILQNAMKMFAPFGFPGQDTNAPGSEAQGEPKPGNSAAGPGKPTGPSGEDFDQLKNQLETVQRRLDALTTKKPSES